MGSKGGTQASSSAGTAEGMDYYSRYPGVAASGMDPYEHYQRYGQFEGRTYGAPHTEGGGFAFEMPDFSAMFDSTDYDAKYAEQQAAAEQKDAESKISTLFSSKYDAADKATTEINTQIADEMAHAQLIGLDYSIDDAVKQQRINDKFANYWGEGDESSLTALTTKYGNAGFTWDLPIVRGTATADTATDKTAEVKAGEKVARSKGAAVSVVDAPLGTGAVLG